jgi:hypothetical protein
MIGQLSLSMRLKESKKAPHSWRGMAENFGRFR